MKLGIVKERFLGENRVAATPETVKKYISLGFSVVVEQGAGLTSSISDKEYQDAGAEIAENSTVIRASDVILKVQPPFDPNTDSFELNEMKKGAIIVSLMNPYDNKHNLSQLASHDAISFGMELIPRISRAQNMDVLSSQSNLAGYKAVLDALAEFGKVVPMMMTAAGTVKPAKILILGAGVAGLQAIATAKRLGGVVSAFDVRPAVKEQVQSLGATFIEVPAESAEGSGGYAKEMSEEYKKKQNALITETLKTQDIVITTALIPGRPAPELISEAMVKDMKPGSVIVDMAVERGGNCALSERGEVVTRYGVKIIGYDNLPSRVAADASALYARNLFNFVSLIVNKEKKDIAINFDDEIIKGCLLTYNGEIVHPSFKGEGSARAPQSAKIETQDRKNVSSKAPPRTLMDQKPHLRQKAKSQKRPGKKES